MTLPPRLMSKLVSASSAHGKETRICANCSHATGSRRVCCGADGSSCPVSATGQVLPPQTCAPACAVAIHSFLNICGTAFDSIVPLSDSIEFNAQFHAFEQRCLSDADPLAFLDAIMVRHRPPYCFYLLLTRKQ